MAKELTDEQIKREQEFMRGLPRVNLGALFMPPVWGPVHGFWVTILYYPALVFVDNLVYEAWREPSVLGIVLTVLVFAILIGVSIAFAIVSQPIAAHRAEDKGMSREQYLKRQRVWAVVSPIILVAMLALATYYNLEIRPTLVA